MDMVFAGCAIRAIFSRYITGIKQLIISLVSKKNKPCENEIKGELQNNRKTPETGKSVQEAYHLQLIASIFRVVGVEKFCM
jgi:5S rRNA maturation endonuclease (ribonuclease M5)